MQGSNFSNMSIEPLVLSIKEQTVKFREALDEWSQSKHQSLEETHKQHRDKMVDAEGMSFLFDKTICSR